MGFVLGLLFVLTVGGELSLITRPLRTEIVLAIPYLVVVLEIGTVGGAILAWRNRYWSRAARVHQTVLAVLGAGFTWQLFELGLFRF